MLRVREEIRDKQSLKRHQKKIHKRSSDENDISENSNETQNDVNLNEKQ